MDPCSSKEKSGNSVDPKFIRQGKFARSAKYFFCALSLANFKFLVFCTHVQIMVQHSTYNLYRTINSCLVIIILNLNVTCPTRTTKQIIGNDVNKSWKAQNLWYLRIKKSQQLNFLYFTQLNQTRSLWKEFHSIFILIPIKDIGEKELQQTFRQPGSNE